MTTTATATPQPADDQQLIADVLDFYNRNCLAIKSVMDGLENAVTLRKTTPTQTPASQTIQSTEKSIAETKTWLDIMNGLKTATEPGGKSPNATLAGNICEVIGKTESILRVQSISCTKMQLSNSNLSAVMTATNEFIHGINRKPPSLSTRWLRILNRPDRLIAAIEGLRNSAASQDQRPKLAAAVGEFLRDHGDTLERLSNDLWKHNPNGKRDDLNTLRKRLDTISTGFAANVPSAADVDLLGKTGAAYDALNSRDAAPALHKPALAASEALQLIVTALEKNELALPVATQQPNASKSQVSPQLQAAVKDFYDATAIAVLGKMAGRWSELENQKLNAADRRKIEASSQQLATFIQRLNRLNKGFKTTCPDKKDLELFDEAAADASSSRYLLADLTLEKEIKAAKVKFEKMLKAIEKTPEAKGSWAAGTKPGNSAAMALAMPPLTMAGQNLSAVLELYKDYKTEIDTAIAALRSNQPSPAQQPYPAYLSIMAWSASMDNLRQAANPDGKSFSVDMEKEIAETVADTSNRLIKLSAEGAKLHVDPAICQKISDAATHFRDNLRYHWNMEFVGDKNALNEALEGVRARSATEMGMTRP